MKISNYPIDEFAVVVVKLSRRILRTNGEVNDCSVVIQWSCFILLNKWSSISPFCFLYRLTHSIVSVSCWLDIWSLLKSVFDL